MLDLVPFFIEREHEHVLPVVRPVGCGIERLDLVAKFAFPCRPDHHLALRLEDLLGRDGDACDLGLQRFQVRRELLVGLLRDLKRRRAERVDAVRGSQADVSLVVEGFEGFEECEGGLQLFGFCSHCFQMLRLKLSDCLCESELRNCHSSHDIR